MGKRHHYSGKLFGFGDVKNKNWDNTLAERCEICNNFVENILSHVNSVHPNDCHDYFFTKKKFQYSPGAK